MAKKDSTGRLSFEKDFFIASGFSTYEDLVFALTNTKKVVIISHYDFDFLNTTGIESLEFLGNCKIDRGYLAFSIPENVDIAIGKGDEYYFSSIKKRYATITYPMICIYKQASETKDLQVTLDDISDNIKKMLDGLNAWLSEDIDE